MSATMAVFRGILMPGPLFKTRLEAYLSPTAYTRPFLCLATYAFREPRSLRKYASSNQGRMRLGPFGLMNVPLSLSYWYQLRWSLHMSCISCCCEQRARSLIYFLSCFCCCALRPLPVSGRNLDSCRNSGPHSREQESRRAGAVTLAAPALPILDGLLLIEKRRRQFGRSSTHVQ